MSGKTHTYNFSLKLSSLEIARYYQGAARDLSVRAETGEQLRFAARHLRPFLSPAGIQGRFQLSTDANHQFQSLSRIDAK